MLLQMQVAQKQHLRFYLVCRQWSATSILMQGSVWMLKSPELGQFLVYSRNSRKKQDSTEWQLIRESMSGMNYMLTHSNTCLKVLLRCWKWVSNSRVLKHVSSRCLSLGRRFHENMNIKRVLGCNIEFLPQCCWAFKYQQLCANISPGCWYLVQSSVMYAPTTKVSYHITHYVSKGKSIVSLDTGDLHVMVVSRFNTGTLHLAVAT